MWHRPEITGKGHDGAWGRIPWCGSRHASLGVAVARGGPPQGALAQSEYGIALANKGRYVEAVNVLTEAIRKRPDQIVIRASCSLSLMYQGRWRLRLLHRAGDRVPL
ncbi:hypothetical protein CYMTET_46193 [Cymbomonas tetramitiformis]|uniref:Tetratricopeptide repeat protein n=1 Tax=Cymbomonas tetramitiformis TaxID=36881 RepID=A0AAE0BWM9_9CHLO|nr:hypothetical protein CYMTET_46193 [Cymbomonas tetramitiformis]